MQVPPQDPSNEDLLNILENPDQDFIEICAPEIEQNKFRSKYGVIGHNLTKHGNMLQSMDTALKSATNQFDDSDKNQ